MISQLKKWFILRDNVVLIIPQWLAFFVVLLTLRIFEFYSYTSAHLTDSVKWSYLVGGISIDFGFSLAMLFTLLAIQSLFFTRKCKTTTGLHVILLLTLLANYALTQTFTKTFEPLDEIIYSFSWRDLKTIVAGETSWFGVILELGVLFLLYFGVNHILLKYKPKGNYLFAGLLATGFLTAPLLNYESEKWLATKLVNNKLVYFSVRSGFYFFNYDSKINELTTIDQEFLGGTYIDKTYPLMHNFQVDKDFAQHFTKKAKQAPNIVFIIVESLSTRFIGKYAESSGHLMPFLDSLSQQSLYFPHIISTAERTYNVLPALLSSTPNMPGKDHFMNLPQPKHWSLMSLLKRDYYSRFYCGVYLEFNNMVNYMNFHETDYLVHDWEKQFNNKFVQKNWWGYPDDQLFDKTILDLNKRHSKLQKSRLDVILTISTHTPYIIPNQKSVKKELLADFQKIPNKTAYQKYVMKHAEEFASYRYTDNSIRAYFEQMKNHPSYANTIFVITGDHGPYIETPDQNALSRAAVPILIVSDLLKKPARYEAISSHLDVLPSLQSLLQENYQVDLPQQVPYMGKGLRLIKKFDTQLHQVISAANYDNSFLIYDDYFLERKQLFRIKSNLLLVPADKQQMKAKLLEKIKNYELLSSYCIYNDRLIPEAAYLERQNGRGYTLYASTKEKFINTSNEFINFSSGDKYVFNKKMDRFKFEVSLDCYLNQQADLDNFAKFAAAISSAETLVSWKQAEAKWSQTQFKKGWNKVKFTIEFSAEELKNLKKFTISYHIWNNNKVAIKGRNVVLKSYIK